MRQQVVTLDAVGTSKWLQTDNRRHGTEFNTSLAVTFDSAGFGQITYDVDLTYDRFDQSRYQKVTISRVTTTATVTLNDHGLSTGDNVEIFDTNYTTHDPESNFEGSFDVVVIDVNSFRYTVANTGATSAIGRAITFRVVKHPTLQGDAVAQAGIQNEPVSAVRLDVTALSAGKATLTVLQQG